jgi:hypothetical protein
MHPEDRLVFLCRRLSAKEKKKTISVSSVPFLKKT